MIKSCMCQIFQRPVLQFMAAHTPLGSGERVNDLFCFCNSKFSRLFGLY